VDDPLLAASARQPSVGPATADERHIAEMPEATA